MDIEPTFSISLQRLKDFLDSAGRGAAYWCDNPLQRSMGVDDALTRKGITVTDKEQQPQKQYTLNIFAIRQGLKRMAEKDPQEFVRILTGEYNNATGDTFMQYALLNEVLYG